VIDTAAIVPYSHLWITWKSAGYATGSRVDLIYGFYCSIVVFARYNFTLFLNLL
jgi:hypothetical protein